MLNIIKVNTGEFKVTEHLAHREAFSNYVLCYHTCSCTLNFYTFKKRRQTLCWRGILQGKHASNCMLPIYRVNMLPLHFMPYQIFAHLACPCMALFLATLVLLHIRSIMFEDLCSSLSKKKKFN